MSISNVSSNSRPGVCTSTTRPSAPYEGQLIYETDTDMLAIWNGTAWRYIAATTPTSGTVLQVVNGTQSIQQTFTTSSPVSGNLSASITPKSSSSKILVEVSVCGINKQANDTGLNLWLYRGANNIIKFGRNIGKLAGSGAEFNGGSASCTYLDSPATTSSVTYTVYGASSSNNVYALFNHSNDTTSTITLMEIAG